MSLVVVATEVLDEPDCVMEQRVKLSQTEVGIIAESGAPEETKVAHTMAGTRNMSRLVEASTFPGLY